MDCEYNPDLVGIDEQSSAKLRATHWIKAMAIIHPQTIPEGRFKSAQYSVTITNSII
jgi:hypothetical protein